MVSQEFPDFLRKIFPNFLAKSRIEPYDKFSAGHRLMPTYRLYKLDEAGKFTAAEGLEAPDDDEAMRAARAAGHAFACEVWLARRLIGRVLAS